MNKIFRLLFTAIVAMTITSACIENDIPYPVIKLDIEAMEAEGLLGSPVIDNVEHTVKMTLEETTDIRKVHITSVTLTEGAESDVVFPGYFDLRLPLYVVLSKYQDYEWVITAEQNIERYFHVEGQIGESIIDADQRIAKAYVPMDHDLHNVVITDLKLGPKEITTYSEEFANLNDFYESVRNITICYHGDIEEVWTLYIEPKDVEVEFTGVDAWAQRIWLYGEGRANSDLGFKYRKVGQQEWSDVEGVTVDGGRFSAVVEGLDVLTSYEVYAFSNDKTTDVVTVTTEDILELPNAGLEEWHKSGDIVFPYAEGFSPFWATGNEGAAMAKTTLTEPSEDVRPGSEGKYSASLQSKKAAIAGLGKFAAGNLFVGEFGGLQGFNGLVNFGRPFVARPVALHGWYKYNCGTIDEVGKVPTARPELKKGDGDEGQILIAVGDWTPEVYGGSATSPVQVDTSKESTYFNKNSEGVIGVGELILTQSSDGWVEFTLPLDYRTTSKIPTHLIIIFTGSRFGDYFTGSTQSLMMVDDLELIY